MEKSKIKERVLKEMENLISLSCKDPNGHNEFNNLHVALLKKHYNAANVNIDYHRHRVEMDIVLDDNTFKSEQVNINIPTLYTNLLFNNLRKFLNTCIDNDHKSIGFYAQLLSSFYKKKNQYSFA